MAQQSREKLAHRCAKGVQFAHPNAKNTPKGVFLPKKVVKSGGFFRCFFWSKIAILVNFLKMRCAN
jgi:hypothetical protein